jgi:hypothetical protein
MAEYFPASQSVHVVELCEEFSNENLPASHCIHCELPSSSLKVPGIQELHIWSEFP